MDVAGLKKDLDDVREELLDKEGLVFVRLRLIALLFLTILQVEEYEILYCFLKLRNQKGLTDTSLSQAIRIQKPSLIKSIGWETPNQRMHAILDTKHEPVDSTLDKSLE